MMSGLIDATALMADAVRKMALLLHGMVVVEDINWGDRGMETSIHVKVSLPPGFNVSTQKWL